MKVTWSGIEYTVWWKYIRDQKTGRHSYHSEFTECHIENLPQCIQIISMACKAPEEPNFCKETGRRVSFKRALQQLFPGNKAARERFWQQYLWRKENAKQLQRL